MKTLKIFKYVGFGILGIGFIFLAIYLTMCLWNWLIPSLFNGPAMSFWQTAGLFLLSKILLTGVSPGSHDRSYKKTWRKKYQEKYNRFHSGGEEGNPAPQVQD
jgi:hypothetical protein